MSKTLELLKMLESGAYGAGSELSFGLLDKVLKDQIEQAKKENPMSFTAGQIGSYFIPGFGIGGAAAKTVKNAGKLEMLLKAAGTPQRLIADAGEIVGKKGIGLIEDLVGKANMQGMLPQLMAKAGESAVSGGVQAGGQALARSATGQADISGAGTSAKEGAEYGVLSGLASPAVSRAAKAIYASPQIASKKLSSEKKAALIEDLLNSGTYGSRETFENKAISYLDDYNKNMGDVNAGIKKAQPNLDSPFDPLRSFEKSIEEKRLAGGDVYPHVKRSATSVEELFKTPKTQTALDQIDVINKEFGKLRQAQSDAQRLRGAPPSSSEGETLSDLKRSFDDWRERMAKKNLSSEQGIDKINRANKSYGLGKDLEFSLSKDINPNYLEELAAAGTGAAIGGAPGAVAAKGLRDIGGTLPVRTGLGLGMYNFAKSPGRLSGRSAEIMNRIKPGSGEEIDPFALELLKQEGYLSDDPFSEEALKKEGYIQ